MLYDDLLSSQRVIVEEIDGEELPRFVAFNRAIEPAKIKGELSYSPDSIESVEIELFLSRPEDIETLNRLFRSCGYNNMDQLKQQVVNPNFDVSLSFIARKPSLEQYSEEILPIEEFFEFLVFETYFGQQLFLNLDYGYTFISAQVKETIPDPN